MAVSDLNGINAEPGPYPFTGETPFPHRIYQFIIDGVRDADQRYGQQLIYRWLLQAQEEWRRMYAGIYGLLDLVDYERAPAAALEYLKWIVGFSGATAEISADATEAELRRLIGMAARLWKYKGTDAGLIEVIECLTSAEARVEDWFKFRLLSDEFEIGLSEVPGSEAWLIPAAGAATAVIPRAVRITGDLLEFDLTTLLGTTESDSRDVRVHCVATKTTVTGRSRWDATRRLNVVISDYLGQSSPVTTINSYRVGVDPAEYCMDLRIADDGSINKAMIEGILRLIRPANERYFLRYVTFLDSFRKPIRWVGTSGAITNDRDSGTLVIFSRDARAVSRPDLVAASMWSNYSARFDFLLGSRTVDEPWVELQFYYADAANYYAVIITPGATYGAVLDLVAVVSGSTAVLDTIVLPVFRVGTYYRLDIDIESINSGSRRIKIQLDGTDILVADDNSFSMGSVAVATGIGQSLTLTYVEVAQKPMTTVRIGPEMALGPG